MLKDKKIMITGGAGFLGSHLVEQLLHKEGVPAKNIFVVRSKDYDLRKSEDVRRLFLDFKADIVIHLATMVKGMGYNVKHLGELFYDNMLIGINVLEEARKNRVEKLLITGTALSYPKDAQMPLKESEFFNGAMDDSMSSYGEVYRALLTQCAAYRKQYGLNSIFVIPANIYGERDHFGDDDAHFIPSVIKRYEKAIVENAPYVENYGSGKASREFIYAEDAARGVILALKDYEKPEPLNIGSGEEILIKEASEEIAKLMGYSGDIRWDTSKPEGQLRRCLDITRAEKEIGFKAEIKFKEGIKKTIGWYEKSKGVLS